MSEAVNTMQNNPRRGQRWFTLERVSSVLLIVTCTVLLWQRFYKPTRPAFKIPSAPMSLDGASLVGNPTAEAVVIEFTDFECPFCGKYAREVFPILSEKYVASNRLVMAIRQLPLKIHASALGAAKAAVCASRQGKFVEMHHSLFEDQKALDEASLFERANALALPEEAFKRCFKEEAESSVRSDIAEAETLKITGTPFFLFGTRNSDGRVSISSVIRGGRPLAEFEAAVEEILAKKSSG
jgi:protein-disulfide isomerase